MKKLFVIFLLGLTGVISTFAQTDSEKMGDRAFKAGEYADAVELYQGAMALMSDSSDGAVAAKLDKAKKCLTLIKNAKRFLAAGDYTSSRQACKTLLSLNPSDPNVGGIVTQCDRYIAQANAVKKDREAWARASEAGTPEAYREYLNKYPSGEYAQTAKDEIAAYEKQRQLLEKEAGAWKYAVFNNTEDSYRYYLNNYSGVVPEHTAEAESRRALCLAVSSYESGDYSKAVTEFDKASGRISLNSYQTQMYESASHEVAYTNLKSSNNKDEALAFLRKYENSKYRDEVRNMICHHYCEEKDFTMATLYASTPYMQEYVKEQEKEYKKTYRKTYGEPYRNSKSYRSSGSSFDWSNMFQGAFGIEAALPINLSATLISVPLELRIGRIDQTFNVLVGETFSWGSTINEAKADDQYNEIPCLRYNQYSTTLQMRFNFADLSGLSDNNARMFVSLGGSLNLNRKSRYTDVYINDYSKDLGNVVIEGIMNPMNYSGRFSIGVGGKLTEFSLFAIYDITPRFIIENASMDVQYDYEHVTTSGPGYQVRNFYDEYKDIRNQIDSRFRIGFSWKFFLFSGSGMF